MLGHVHSANETDNFAQTGKVHNIVSLWRVNWTGVVLNPYAINHLHD